MFVISECLSLTSLSSLMFVIKTGAYPSGTLKEAPEFDGLLALPTNIRLGWKGLPGANTSTYHDHS